MADICKYKTLNIELFDDRTFPGRWRSIYRNS